MIRKIIKIDEDKCVGCGLCANACHEGAIDMVDGKAKLARESFCDGFGDCLPACPTGAITFEEREAPEYDEAAVKASQKAKDEDSMDIDDIMKIEDDEKRRAAMEEHLKNGGLGGGMHPGGCPGSRAMSMNNSVADESDAAVPATGMKPVSRLNQWPCQIKLLPTQAPFYDGAKLLVAADCAAYAYANLHEDFMKGRITMIGCPKLDGENYTDKLTEIISNNDIKGVLVVRMEVPCCAGIQAYAETALKNSGKFIPWQVVTLSRDGRILDD